MYVYVYINIHAFLFCLHVYVCVCVCSMLYVLCSMLFYIGSSNHDLNFGLWDFVVHLLENTSSTSYQKKKSCCPQHTLASFGVRGESILFFFFNYTLPKNGMIRPEIIETETEEPKLNHKLKE